MLNFRLTGPLAYIVACRISVGRTVNTLGVENWGDVCAKLVQKRLAVMFNFCYSKDCNHKTLPVDIYIV